MLEETSVTISEIKCQSNIYSKFLELKWKDLTTISKYIQRYKEIVLRKI